MKIPLLALESETNLIVYIYVHRYTIDDKTLKKAIKLAGIEKGVQKFSLFMKYINKTKTPGYVINRLTLLRLREEYFIEWLKHCTHKVSRKRPVPTLKNKCSNIDLSVALAALPLLIETRKIFTYS